MDSAKKKDFYFSQIDFILFKGTSNFSELIPLENQTKHVSSKLVVFHIVMRFHDCLQYGLELELFFELELCV